MRTIEILILLTLFLALIGRYFPPIKKSRWVNWIPSLALLLTVIHLLVEKPRLQMVPAYGVVLVLFLLSLPRLKRGGQPPEEQPSRWARAIAGFLLSLLLFAFVAIPPVLFPVFRLPQPTGPHAVGTTTLHLVDPTRPETFTPDPLDHRELAVQVWYPAQSESDSRPATYMQHMPLQFSHLSLLRTQTYQDVALSAAQSAYPVLIFSPGYIAWVEQSLTLMEELASHGYVVFSIAHTYHALVTAFPDGRVIPADPTLLNDYFRGAWNASEHLGIWTDDTLALIDELVGHLSRP